ncbi:MAG TPA: DUF3644 domain-containing protein [Herpetosiphonaceae bacterium]|nr:DUF3644 domain-containing protein [Herpetosiphonaceae bacterium]
MSAPTLALAQKRADAIKRCMAKYHLPANPAIDEALLRYPGTPDRPSKKLAVLIMAYKREVPIRDLSRLSDQPGTQIRALRDNGFIFQGGGPNSFHYLNEDGAPCRKILGFAQPRREIKRRARAILEKSIAACVAAIDTYNKPDCSYREETFSILLVNAWELLLKARIIYDNNDAVESIQATDHLGSPRRGRSGNLLTIDISHCLAILARHNQLSRNARTNLEMLMEVRDNAIHYLTKDRDFRQKVQEIGVASLQNYMTAVHAWFNTDLSAYNFCLLPLAFFRAADPLAMAAQGKERELQNLLRYFQAMEGASTDNREDLYAVTLRLAPQFVSASIPAGAPAGESPDEDGMRIQR